jgi:hypothetical protein
VCRGTERAGASLHGESLLVALQELVVSNAYEIAALFAVLEQKDILTQGEVLDQVKRLGEEPRKAR